VSILADVDIMEEFIFK